MKPRHRLDYYRVDFKIPQEGAFEDLPVVPDHLLKPLTGEQHGGQITLLPGGSHVDLDPALVSKGIIFTDIRPQRGILSFSETYWANRQTRRRQVCRVGFCSCRQWRVVICPKNSGDTIHSVLWGPGQTWHTSLIS
jgi:hypothetical protein